MNINYTVDHNLIITIFSIDSGSVLKLNPSINILLTFHFNWCYVLPANFKPIQYQTPVQCSGVHDALSLVGSKPGNKHIQF
jgi:hypothetical protein